MVRKLLGISELAILGVLLFHAAGWGFIAMFAWTNRSLPVAAADGFLPGDLAYYGLRAIEQLVVFVIPAFLFVSGYFVAVATGRNGKTVRWSIVGARIKTLLIPYLLWSFLLWGMMFLEGKIFSPIGYVELLLTGRTNPAYYYVPLLISFYLISPWIVQWAKNRWIALLVVAALVQSTVQLLYYPTLLGIQIPVLEPYVDIVPKWFFAARLFWFVLGVVAGFHLLQYKSHLVRYRWHLCALALVLFFAGMVEWEQMVHLSRQEWLGHRETLLDSLFSLTVILCLLAFDQVYTPLTGAISDLSSKSYGIYLIHSPVMEVVARVAYKFVPFILGYQFLFQPLLLVFGLGVPLLLMWIVSRSPWRGYYRYVFG
jgi:hypothetical protein